MRKISASRKTDIEDASTAGFLKSLPPTVIEKEIHITDVLFMLAGLDPHIAAYPAGGRHRDSDKVEVRTRLVFSGGTCLSKAYGIIERMSEDIDIKVVLEDLPEAYVTRKGIGKSGRSRLATLHEAILNKLAAMEFELTEVEDNLHIKDARRYFHVCLGYESVFDTKVAALRAELKLEVIHRHPQLPYQPQSIGYLLDAQLAQAGVPLSYTPRTVPMLCFAVEETLGEKVLSLLRRCAWNWDGYQRGEFDQALVRHIYDVWRIREARPEALAQAERVFEALVATDVNEFGGQHAEFSQSPKRVLERALQRAKSDAGLIQNYRERLIPLLFAEDPPSYEQAFAGFEDTARHLLGALSERF